MLLGLLLLLGLLRVLVFYLCAGLSLKNIHQFRVSSGSDGQDDEDEEEPNLFIDNKGVDDKEDTTALCLLGKLFTDKPYNTYGLMETMKMYGTPYERHGMQGTWNEFDIVSIQLQARYGEGDSCSEKNIGRCPTLNDEV